MMASIVAASKSIFRPAEPRVTVVSQRPPLELLAPMGPPLDPLDPLDPLEQRGPHTGHCGAFTYFVT